MEINGEEYSLTGSTGGMATVKLNLSLRIMKTAEKQTEDGDGDSTEKGEVDQSKVSKPAPVPKESLRVTQPSPAPAVPPPDVPVLASSEPSSLSSDTIVKSVESTLPKQDKTNMEKPGDSLIEEDRSGSPTETSIIEEIAPPASLTTPATLSMEPQEGLRQRAVSTAGIHGLGRIQLSVKYGPKSNMVVVVHKVENLPLEEDGEIPDPYVKLYLLPDKSKDSKRKTDVIKDEQNPVFDERFEYSISQNELTHRTLEVSVINKKGFTFLAKSATMGQIRLDCGLLDPDSVTQWYDLNPEINSDEE